MSREIMKCIHGSHLYGLDTPNSDMDYKGIFIPDLNDLLLSRAPKEMSRSTGNNDSKNTSGDTDVSLFSLSYFIDMACKGETICIDMLHTPDEFLHVNSELWQFIRENRSKFYTKNMKAFLGYARKQAAKYGVKGSRMGALEEVHIFTMTNKNLGDARLYRLDKVWDELPINEHCKFIEEKTHFNDNQKFYEVLGSKYQDRMPLDLFIKSIREKWNSYGERARLAKENHGVDWKAVSHAIRASYQLQDIFSEGDIIFPFTGRRKEFLLDVKQGNLDFLTVVQPELEESIEEVELLSEKSRFPDKVDRTVWDEFVLDVYKSEFIK